jgi:hypothetical protein
VAIYFVASGGSNTAPYDTWAKAATSLQTALTAASTAGDIVVIQYNAVPTGDAQVGANTTYTVAANIAVIAASNDGGSAFTPTAMGTANWVGNSTTARSLTLAGAFKVLWYGLTLRTASTTSMNLVLGNSDNNHYEYEDCYFWQGNTNTGSTFTVGATSSSINTYAVFKNCTFRFGATAHNLIVSGGVDWFGGSIASAGSIPTTLLSLNIYASHVNITGADLSNLGSSNIVTNGTTAAPVNVTLVQCKLGSGYSLRATGAASSKSSSRVLALDCSSGDTHGIIEYTDAFGTLTSDTGIYFTAGAAAQSWKIVTTANCSYATPFVSPWISLYNTGTSAITPYLEILRDGSTTAYTNAQVWGEFSAKTNTGFTQASFSADSQTLASWAAGTTASNQAAGAGLGSWTGEAGSAWSGKVDSGSSLTPAEAGHIRGRAVVGAPSITVYVDPQIRT